MPKLTTGNSLRGTTTTSRPFFSEKRGIGGRASSAGLGGAGAWMRSLRPAQYSRGGLCLAGAAAGAGLASAWAGPAAGAGGGGDDAQAVRKSAVNVSDRDFISWPPGRVARG